MTREDALEKLELHEGASPAEITQKYNEFYNEFQLRITNAPTEHQRKLYQKKFEELEVAFNILNSGGISSQEELPGISESAADNQEKVSSNTKQSKGNATKEISEEAALTILGLKQPFTLLEISHAYEFKKKGLLKTAETTELESIKEAIENEVLKLKLACDVLIPKATVAIKPMDDEPVVHKKSSEDQDAKKSVEDQNSSIKAKRNIAQIKPEKQQEPKVPKDQEKRKRKFFIAFIASLAVIAVLAFIFIPNDQEKQTSRTTAINKGNNQFDVLKRKGDSLAILTEYELALEKYRAAISIQESEIVSDSINSIENRLANKPIASINEKDVKKDQIEAKTSKKLSYEEKLEQYDWVKSKIDRLPANTVIKNNKYGTVGYDGDVRIPLIYDRLDVRQSLGCIIAEKNGKYGLLDLDGKIMAPFIYDLIQGFGNRMGLAEVKKNNLYGYMDIKGEIIIPIKYTGACGYGDGRACVQENGLYGYLDRNGKLIIPFKYYNANQFWNGTASVQLRGVNGMIEIDTEGNCVKNCP